MRTHERLERVLITALRPQHKLALSRWPALHPSDYTAEPGPVPPDLSSRTGTHLRQTRSQHQLDGSGDPSSPVRTQSCAVLCGTNWRAYPCHDRALMSP
jgi:hypothetical protein